MARQPECLVWEAKETPQEHIIIVVAEHMVQDQILEVMVRNNILVKN